MTQTLMNLLDVRRRTGKSRSSLYNAISDGAFPMPIKWGRSSRWPEHEVNAVIEARIRGATDAEVRTLVEALVAARQRGGITVEEGRKLVEALSAGRGTDRTLSMGENRGA